MPSVAFDSFRKKIKSDVDRLIGTYDELNPGGRGRRHLGHITGSAVVVLSAAWELYIEEVLVESVDHFLRCVESASILPEPTKRVLSDSIKDDKHDYAPLFLADDGWKTRLRTICLDKTEKLNTPKTENITTLFRQLLGYETIGVNWTNDTEDIDNVITVRGGVAHRGTSDYYVKNTELLDYRRIIVTTAFECDNSLPGYFKKFDSSHRSWRRMPEQTLESCLKLN